MRRTANGYQRMPGETSGQDRAERNDNSKFGQAINYSATRYNKAHFHFQKQNMQDVLSIKCYCFKSDHLHQHSRPLL